MDIKSGLKESRKFALIVFFSTAINYAVFFVFYYFFHVYYPIAFVLAYFVGVIFGFVLNRARTFSSLIPKTTHELVLFITVYSLSLITSIAVLRILVEKFSLNPLSAGILAMGVSMVLNFLGRKFLVFSASAQQRIGRIDAYFTKPFWAIFSVKVLAGFLFGSHFIVQGFLPFVNYFNRTLTNPYQHFYSLGQSIFPYPGGMLAIISLPFTILSRVIPPHFFSSVNLQLFVLRLPILAADVLLYVLLCLMLPTKEKKVLWLYFASPILFYINYFHGQLDVIPTALLFLSAFTLYKNKSTQSFLALGLGIAVKTHLAAALPFYWAYLYRNKFSLKKIALLSLYSVLVFLVFNPFLFSSGFIGSVLNNPEQQRLFSLAIPFGLNALTLYVAPAAILLIFYKFATYKRLNFDSLLLALGLTYIILVALVPPMQGWFYWSLPFLIFFYIKYKDSAALSIWAINGLYLLYFAFVKNSDIFESLQPISRALAQHPNFYDMIQNRGGSAQMPVNILFTALEGFLVATTAWAYRVGIYTTEVYQKKKERFVLGISGDSGVGKSTLAGLLANVFGQHNAVFLNGDDVHKWERGDSHWQQLSHLNPKGNWVHTDLEHALSLLKGETVERLSYDHATGKFIGPLTLKSNKYIVFQGLMPFMLDQMRELYDLKVYVEADEDLRVKWKTERDVGERGASVQAAQEQILFRQPDAKKYIHPQKSFADWVIRYIQDEGSSGFAVEYLFKNSIFMERLVEELSRQPGLGIDHSYFDLSLQRLKVSGSLDQTQIEQIAYKLYPNLVDLLENQPVFVAGINGIHQLFFINYLNHFYKLKKQHGALP